MTPELALDDRVSEGSARTRLERLLFASVGFAALVYGAVLFPGINGIEGQTPQLEAWYGRGLIAIAVVFPIVLGVLTWLVPRTVMRRLGAATALLFLVAMMAFPWESFVISRQTRSQMRSR